MKITDGPSPPPDPSLNDSDVDSSQDDDQTEEPSTFSRVLAKKQQARQDTATFKGGKRGEGELDAAETGATPTPPAFGQTAQPEAVEAKRAVEVPAQLQQLIREISVVAGKQQVHIELNSNVLKGLHIRIEKQNGAVAIQFQSNSPEVAGLLSKNLDTLSQGLADRGVSVADIRITGPQESAGAQAYKSRSNAGERGRWQGGRQGGRR